MASVHGELKPPPAGAACMAGRRAPSAWLSAGPSQSRRRYEFFLTTRYSVGRRQRAPSGFFLAVARTGKKGDDRQGGDDEGVAKVTELTVVRYCRLPDLSI